MPEQRWEYEERYYFGYCMNILRSPKPTIAQVEGACIAGGFMLANMCDLMVASEDAYFADPVVHTMANALTTLPGLALTVSKYADNVSSDS